MTQFDIAVVAVLGLSVLFAWMRGLGRELGTLIAIGLGVLAIMFLAGPIEGIAGGSAVMAFAVYGLLFLGVFIVTSILFEVLFSKLLGAKPIRGDKIAGAIFGLIRGWLLLGLVYLFVTILYDEDAMPVWIDDSMLKWVATSGAAILEGAGLETEALSVDTPDETEES